MSDTRLELLQQWLREQAGLPDFSVAVASADASFRRYFRITAQDKSFIVMDAPPEHEDCGPFVKIARAFGALGLHVPEIIGEDLSQGFLLLSDLGDVQYAQVLNAQSVDELYGDAMDALLKLQCGGKAQIELPPYDEVLLQREMDLFFDWFMGTHLSLQLDEQEVAAMQRVRALLVQSALQQPQVWVHRDYHSRNLMQVADNNPGILDFQDAVVGAITYDLVSLLRDCYVAWPVEQVEAWVEAYRQRLSECGLLQKVDSETFLRWFDLMGVQRHMKAIGIFARLNHRDGKSGYLADIPRTMNYVLNVCEKYPQLKPLHDLITQKILPVFNTENGQKL